MSGKGALFPKYIRPFDEHYEIDVYAIAVLQLEMEMKDIPIRSDTMLNKIKIKHVFILDVVRYRL